MNQPDFVLPVGYRVRRADDRIIISLGVGSAHYAERLRSTRNHCNVYEPDTWQLFYEDWPTDSPTHDRVPYGFKVHAIQRAYDAGFRYVIWMDSSVQPVASLAPVWDRIAECGWYVPPQGDSVLGNWCTKEALEIYGITRLEAMSIRLCWAAVFGVDMRSRAGHSIWTHWRELYNLGAWPGPKESHRHDESAMSFVLHSLGLQAPFTGWVWPEGAGAILEHNIPDYNIPEMRRRLLALDGSEEVKQLCR